MIAYKDIKKDCLIVDGKGKIIGKVKSIDLDRRDIIYSVNGIDRRASYEWLINHFYFIKPRKNKEA